MNPWTLVMVLLCDEAVATVTRRLVDLGFTVTAALPAGLTLGAYKGQWEGRVVAWTMTHPTLKDREAIGAAVIKAAARVNFLAYVLSDNGLRICGPHLVDALVSVPRKDTPTVYDAISDD